MIRAQGNMESGSGMFGGESSSGRRESPLAQAMGTRALCAGMVSHLAKGGLNVAKAKVAGTGDPVSQAYGRKAASAIRANMEKPEFTGNILPVPQMRQ